MEYLQKMDELSQLAIKDFDICMCMHMYLYIRILVQKALTLALNERETPIFLSTK